MSFKHTVIGMLIGTAVTCVAATYAINSVNILPKVKCYTVPVDNKLKSKYPIDTFEYEVKRTE